MVEVADDEEEEEEEDEAVDLTVSKPNTPEKRVVEGKGTDKKGQISLAPWTARQSVSRRFSHAKLLLQNTHAYWNTGVKNEILGGCGPGPGLG